MKQRCNENPMFREHFDEEQSEVSFGASFYSGGSVSTRLMKAVRRLFARFLRSNSQNRTRKDTVEEMHMFMEQSNVKKSAKMFDKFMELLARFTRKNDLELDWALVEKEEIL